MYVYQLTHVRGVEIKVIGYFGSWKKARQVMKKYRSQVQGFKDYPRCFQYRFMKTLLREVRIPFLDGSFF